MTPQTFQQTVCHYKYNVSGANAEAAVFKELAESLIKAGAVMEFRPDYPDHAAQIEALASNNKFGYTFCSTD